MPQNEFTLFLPWGDEPLPESMLMGNVKIHYRASITKPLPGDEQFNQLAINNPTVFLELLGELL